MKAYKVFNDDWTCRGFQYVVGETYVMEGAPVLCSRGYHACRNVSDCFSYYEFNISNKVAEVELSGTIVGMDSDKQATNKITIIREITWEDVLLLANSGHSNSGHSNSGHRNSGDRNSGHWNSGHWNSGDRNSGHWNSGHWNSGHRNSGHRNSGDRNSGHSNSGHWNSGHWNSGDRNSGLFNTDKPKCRMFNKNTNYTIDEIDVPSFMYFNMTQWVSYDTATEEEKEKYKEDIEVCGGFLKLLDYKTAFKRAWGNASEKDKIKVQELPNFDPDIFYEISGIDTRTN